MTSQDFDEKEKQLIARFVAREILTDVDGGLRRAVSKLLAVTGFLAGQHQQDRAAIELLEKKLERKTAEHDHYMKRVTENHYKEQAQIFYDECREKEATIAKLTSALEKMRVAYVEGVDMEWYAMMCHAIGEAALKSEEM